MKPIPGRLHAQALVGSSLASATDVVRHLGAVQSQLPDMALWAVGRRLRDATLAELRESFDRGDFLRTHVLRPTWHFVVPEDVHWLQALTGHRVQRLLRTTNRSIALSDAVVERGVAVVVAALADGAARSRAELATALTDAGLAVTGQAVAHVVMSAETDALVVNGPMRGKQHTYRLLGASPPLPARDDMLADIARRYAQGHGAFRAKDLAWWTSLTLTDSRRAIRLADLRPADVPGDDHWMLDAPVEADVPRAMLLANFDEYISYARDPADRAGYNGTADDLMRGAGLLLVDGLIVGRWSRTISARRVAIEVEATPRITGPVRRALEAEAAAFGSFVGREPELVVG